MDERLLQDVISIAWMVVFSTMCVLACFDSSSRNCLPDYFSRTRRDEGGAERIAKQALGVSDGGMDYSSEWQDALSFEERKQEEEMSQAQSPGTLLQLMHDKFPGMEHYFISDEYEAPMTPHGRRAKNNPHRAHIGFIYCGFVDSLFEPIQARCWRSVTYNGCYRLILSDDPEYHQDETAIPETRRRFNF